MDNSPYPSQKYLAFDLGAESGRAILGWINSGRLEIQEIHRFPIRCIQEGDSLFWDVQFLWDELKRGLSLATKAEGGLLYSLGIDTWGVDFVLLDKDDRMLGNPHSYRDPRTQTILEAAKTVIPHFDVFQQTGNQVMPINSLYQLFSMVKANSVQLARAKTFLNIPDLFNFWFSGEKASELTIATTTQCFDLRSHEWSREMLGKMGINSGIFTRIVPPGTILGKVKTDLARELNTSEVRVVTVASHDTQSAILAVPAVDDNYLYLSSGTWSLMGIETNGPLINNEVFANGMTNEGGYGGKYCLLKNITGLWLLQECRRNWRDEGHLYSYEELIDQAYHSESFCSLIVPTDPIFLPPGDMVGRIQSYCRESGQNNPDTPGAITRCILESLALEYRSVADTLTSITGRAFPVIHIIGGGSRNQLLNQFTANATGKRVVAGPVEATAIGNILVQAISAGQVKSITEARMIVCSSFDVSEFTPENGTSWDSAYMRYKNLIKES